MMDIWLPPKPAIIIPAPKELQPSALGLTLMASTWGLRVRRQAAASAVISFVNAGAEVNQSETTFELTAPSSPVSGDTWIAVIGHGFDQVHSIASDWTQIVQATDEIGLSVWWHRYAGSTPELTVTSTSDNEHIAGIASFRGCAASPVNAAGAVTTGLTSATIAHSAITPTKAGCVLLVINCASNNDSRTALGGGYSVAFEDSAASTQNCFIGSNLSLALSYDLDIPVSSTGTVNQTQAGSNRYASVLIALEPA